MIEIKSLNKIYKSKDGLFFALKDINLTFKDGEFVAILGESGSGKSTLLNMISGIDTYTSGDLIVNGINTRNLSDGELRDFRFNHVGFVFQRYNLVNHLSALDNVALPLIFSGLDKKEYQKKAMDLLKELQLDEFSNVKVGNFSGGQKQRIAIARSMLMNPDILLCDEPTGSLDSESGEIVMDLVKKVSENRIVILVTHDETIAHKYADRIIRIRDGEIISDEYNKPVEDKQTNPIKKEFVSPNNKQAIKLIAKNNFIINRKINYKIIISIVIGLSLLFFINFFLNNIINYNKLMFERNNDYKKYYVTSNGNNDDVLYQLNREKEISEAGYENTYLVKNSYFVKRYKDIGQVYFSQNETKSLNDVHHVVLQTMPKSSENFYLNQMFLAKSDKKVTNGVYVTQELIYSHYLGKSFIEAHNEDWYPLDEKGQRELIKRDFFKDYPIESFINSSIYICGRTVNNSPCFETVIVGILDSNEVGINYAGNIFISQEGFAQFNEYLKQEFNVKEVDSMYSSKMYYYYKDYNDGKNQTSILENKYNITVLNDSIETYQGVRKLEIIANFTVIVLIVSLYLIYFIVVFNMIKDNIEMRKVDVGVYTSLGIGVNTIKKIFLFESINVIKRIVLFLTILYGLLIAIFIFINPRLITNTQHLLKDFDRKFTVSYEWGTFIVVLVLTCFIHFLSVFFFSHKVSKKKAIEVLSW